MTLATAKATVTLRDLTVKFDRAVRAATPFYPQICTIIQSSGLDEKYAWLGDMPGIREWLSDRLFKELRAANFVLANKHWESSLLIKKTDIDDDRLGLYGPVLEQLGVEAAYHPDELLFETLLANGHSTACYDGQYFFDTDHAWGDSGTQDNDLTGAAATGTDPTAAEFKDAFHTARRTMMEYRNDQGKLLNRPVVTSMGQFLVIVPSEMEVAAYTGLYSDLFGGGNTNIVRDRPQIICSPHLTNSAVFYLINLAGVFRPFVFQARQPLKRQMKGLDDLETKDAKFMTEARYNAGYYAWWTSVRYEFT